MSLADATTVDLAPWAVRFPSAAVGRRDNHNRCLLLRVAADVTVAASRLAVLVAVVAPFDDRLVTFWPTPALVFVLLLLWRWR
jgi:hypothetical protein